MMLLRFPADPLSPHYRLSVMKGDDDVCTVPVSMSPPLHLSRRHISRHLVGQQNRTIIPYLNSNHVTQPLTRKNTMSTELILLSCTLLLALVQIMLSAVLRTRETGAAYNTGPRDTDGPPFGVLTGRMLRAQKNLFETLPLFIAAVLIVTLSKGENIYSL